MKRVLLVIAGALVLSLLWGLGSRPDPEWPEPTSYLWEQVNYDEPTLPEAAVVELPLFDPLAQPAEVPGIEIPPCEPNEPLAFEGRLRGFALPEIEKGYYWTVELVISGGGLKQPNAIMGDSYLVRQGAFEYRIEGFVPAAPGRYRATIMIHHPVNDQDILQLASDQQKIDTPLCEGELVVAPRRVTPADH